MNPDNTQTQDPNSAPAVPVVPETTPPPPPPAMVDPSPVQPSQSEHSVQTPPVEEPKGGSGVMKGAIIFLVVALVAVIGFVAYSIFLVPKPAPSPVPVVTPRILTSPSPVATSSATPSVMASPTATASPTLKATATPSGTPAY